METPKQIEAGKTGKLPFWKKPGILHVCHLGIGFTTLFMGFQACQNFVTTLHPKDGYIALGLSYFVLGLSCFFSPIVVQKLGIRASIWTSAFWYGFFVITVMSFFGSFIIPSSILLGVGSAILWSAQPCYINYCAPEGKIAEYSGFFYAFFAFSGIIGNLAAGTIVQTISSTNILLIVLAVFCYAGMFILVFLRHPPRVEEFNNEKKIEPVKFVKDVFGLLKDRRIYLMIFLCCQQGQALSLFFGTFTVLMRYDIIGFVMATYGTADAIGSVFWGRVYDKKGWRPLLYSTPFFVAVGLAGMCFCTMLGNGTFLFYIVAIFYGMVDAIQFNLVFATVAQNFKNENPLPAFAITRCLNSVSSGISFIVYPYMGLYSVVGVFFFTVIMSTVCIQRLHSSLGVTPFKSEVTKFETEDT
eukprot:TRINITY_DN1206_c0_g3_i2.p1 TRINITY_DN1206_c0_g3~~TRINITY_DN1206_c0_g3_i2.p1  ORF type:complete len:414 (+),score=36.88 TRINITY_DN1206_c0_g3_i2:157-1398(+)